MEGDPWAAYPIVTPAGSDAAASDDDWDAYPIVKPAKKDRRARRGEGRRPTDLTPTGEVQDGDTFRTASGQNARLYGVDAFERGQMGRSGIDQLVAIGDQSRKALIPYADAGASVTPTGDTTYGRPVVTLENNGDAGSALLRQGLGLTVPQYLRSDAERFLNYTQDERLARLNRIGAHATTYQTPKAERQGKPDPWAEPEQARRGEGDAVFFDDPTPFAGLKPEVERGYLAIWQDMASKPEDLIAYAKENGFTVDPKNVRDSYDDRAKTKLPSGEVTYRTPPRVLTDMKDGAVGAALRGFGDPINLLDESAAVLDTIVPGTDRENLWSSDRRFGDVYANNLEQNRAILDYDDANHPWARFGGQLVSGVALPGGSVKGVGFAAAREAMRSGATRFGAQSVARTAVLRRLGTAGAIEGGVAGAGSGEDTRGRLTGAAIGAPAGGVLGVGLGLAAPVVAKAVGRPFNRLAGREGERAAENFTDGAIDTTRAGVLNDVTPDGPAVSSSALTDAVSAPAASRTPGDDPWAAYPIVEPATTQGPGRPGALSSDEYVTRFAKPGNVRDYVEQPETGDRMGSAVIGPDGRLHMFRTNGSEFGHADEVGHYDFGYAVGPDVADQFAAVTRYRGEIAVTRSANESPQQARAINEMVARARRNGLNIIDEEPKQPTSDAARAEFADLVAQYEAAQPMRAEMDTPTLTGPSFTDDLRSRDMIDVNARPMLDDPTDAQRMAQAERIRPSDVLARPAADVDTLAEADRIAAGRIAPVRAPNEADELARRNIQSLKDGTKTIPKRGPLDLVTWLRTQGGIKAQGGELDHYGIDNASRDLDFAKGEQRFGPLVSNDGMGYDDAAHAAWEAGYFPDLPERPTIPEFLDALNATHTGRNRAFHPDDLPEVDAFERARQQRYDVEAGKDRGAPLAEDRGQPVDMADMDANAAPVSAFEEWGDNAPTIAGNLRLDKLDSPQAIRRALVETHQRVGGFDAATRGRITQAETASLASELGMTADDLLKRRKGQAFNAEEALAARQILARSATDLVNIAKRIARQDNPGDEAEAGFQQAWLRHVAIQEQVSGATAEAGRALSQFRMAADSRLASRAISSLELVGGGPSRIKEVAERIVDLEAAGTSPAGLNRFAAIAMKPRFKDKLTELWYNWLLSGPQTHAVNILSNTLTAMTQVPEHAMAAAFGGVRASARRRDAAIDRVLFSEVGTRSIGLLQGTKEGLREAARTFRTGEPSDAVTKVEGQSQRAISGVKGSIIRTPTRALAAEDELFKAMARRMELTGLAVRHAAGEGLKGEARRARVGELIEHPTDRMLSRSFDYGRYLTFQTPLAHGSVSQGISLAAQKWPLLKLIVPFVRTPVNIMKYAAERSPVAPAVGDWRKQFMAGGADRDLAVAKMMIGSGIMAATMEQFASGHVTGGGPADKGAAQLMRADGWQPYSVKIGDRYYSYQRLDPIATTVGVAADFAELQSHMTEKQQEDVAGLLVMATVKNLSDKVWFSGVTDLSDAISDPDRYGGTFARRLAGSIAVPASVAQTARVIDPTLRDAQTMLDAIRARIPYASRSLMPRRDAFGVPITREGGLGPDILSPIWTSTAKRDPVISELLKADVGVSRIKRGDYTPQQYDDLQGLAGSMGHSGLEALIRAGEWRNADADEKEKLARNTIARSRKDAKAILGLSALGKSASSATR